MLFLKIYYHLRALITIIFYKILYRNKLRIGFGLSFRSNFSLLIGAKGNVKIGNNCFFNHNCSIASLKSVVIGNGSVFGENVKIYDHNHLYDNPYVSLKEQGYSIAPISIGEHCWISSNVIILKGVEIGNNCVIGAGCIVYKSIPSNKVLISQQNYKMIDSINL